VRAPRAGVVVSADAARGVRVWPGFPLFEIADLSRLSVKVPVTLEMASRISTGDLALVNLPFAPLAQVQGEVVGVGPAPGRANGRFVVEIVVPNPQPRTNLSGRKCTVEFPS
jgi:multidrug resistance efflux pump